MKIEIAPGVSLEAAELWKVPAFLDWAKRNGHRWRGTITVIHAHRWRDRVVSLLVEIAPDDDTTPQKIVLRSPTVDVLVVVSNGGRWRPKKFCIFVEQYLPAVGCKIVSNPAGDLRWGEDPFEVAERQVHEDLDLDHPDFARFDLEFQMIGLTREPVAALPRATNERVHMYRRTIEVCGRRAFRQFVRLLDGRQTSSADEGGQRRLHAVPILVARAFVEGQATPDSNTLLSIGRAGL